MFCVTMPRTLCSTSCGGEGSRLRCAPSLRLRCLPLSYAGLPRPCWVGYGHLSVVVRSRCVLRSPMLLPWLHMRLPHAFAVSSMYVPLVAFFFFVWCSGPSSVPLFSFRVELLLLQWPVAPWVAALCLRPVFRSLFARLRHLWLGILYLRAWLRRPPRCLVCATFFLWHFCTCSGGTSTRTAGCACICGCGIPLHLCLQ